MKIKDSFAQLLQAVGSKRKRQERIAAQYQNPWPGLDSYDRPVDGQARYLFCGRKKEVGELAALIRENLIVTLYGKSGIGKTSLVNAGLAPRLEQLAYMPITIRLGEEARDMNMAQCIVQRVEKMFAVPGFGCQLKEEAALLEPEQEADGVGEDSTEFLLDFFSRRTFFRTDGQGRLKEVFPVIILDQFEEIFRKWKKPAQQLLMQLNELTTDYYNGMELAGNYRFLLSIREDDLYLLEESLDENYIQSMKRNRFRLRRMQDEQATEVIMKPGEEYLDEKDRTAIVENIIRAAKDNDERVSSLLLSLICSRLFQQAIEQASTHVGGSDRPVITLAMTEKIGGDYLLKFYQQLVAQLKLSGTQLEIIERLVNNGRRESLPKAGFDKVFHPELLQKLTKGEYAILRIIDDEHDDRVELIHDAFCPVVDEYARQRQLSRRTIIELLVLVPFYVVVLYLARKIYPYSVAHEYHTSGWLNTGCHWLHFWFIAAAIFIPATALPLVRKTALSYGWAVFSLFVAEWPLVFDFCLKHGLGSSFGVGDYAILGFYQLPQTVFILCTGLSLFVLMACFYTRQYEHNETENETKADSICFIFFFFVYAYYKLCVPFADGCFYYHQSGVAIGLALVLTILFTNLFSTGFSYDYKGDNSKYYWFAFVLLWITVFAFHGTPMPFINVRIPMPMPAWMRLLTLTVFMGWAYYHLYTHTYKGWKAYALCAVNTLFFAFTLVFTLGYNPFAITGDVSMFNQEGVWRWKTVLAVNENNHFELRRALDGEKVIEASFEKMGFDNADNQLGCLLVTDTLSAIPNDLYEGIYQGLIGVSHSVIHYWYSSAFEQKLHSDAAKGSAVAQLIISDRELILRHLQEGTDFRKEEFSALHDSVLNQELNELMGMLNTDSTYSKSYVRYRHQQLKQRLAEVLTLGLSTSMLHNAVKDMELDHCYGFIRCFNRFVCMHYYKELIEDPLIDWDEQFEEVTEAHLNNYYSPDSLRNDYLQKAHLALYNRNIEERGVQLEVSQKRNRLEELFDRVYLSK